MGMWMIFHKSFQRNLTEVLKYDEEESRKITALAKKKYRELIERLPEFEKAGQIQDEYRELCHAVCIFPEYANTAGAFGRDEVL